MGADYSVVNDLTIAEHEELIADERSLLTFSNPFVRFICLLQRPLSSLGDEYIEVALLIHFVKTGRNQLRRR